MGKRNNIIQVSVIKDACNPDYDGGVESLFTKTAGLVDGYVVRVDSSSTDGTYDAAGKALEGTGKPFDLYEAEWPDDFSAAINDAIGRAEAGMAAGWIFKLDGDMRIIGRGSVRSVRKYVTGCKRRVIQFFCPSADWSHFWYPVVFTGSGVRYEGIVLEMPERPEPQLLRNYDIAPFAMAHYKRCGTEGSENPVRARMMEREAKRLHDAIDGAGPEQLFRIANRFKEISTDTLNPGHSQWHKGAVALYRKAMEGGYEPGDCLGALCALSIRAGDAANAIRYVGEAMQYIGDDVERFCESVDTSRLQADVRSDIMLSSFRARMFKYLPV